MRILVLDDSVERHKTFRQNLIGHEKVIHVHTHDEAERAIQEHEFDLMFLDHDLNFEAFKSVKVDENGVEWELTGADVAKLVAALPKEKHPKRVIIHSYNPSGAFNILMILQAVGIKAVRDPFSAYSGKDLG